MKKLTQSFILVFSSILLITSCEEDKTRGCTEPKALNRDFSAEEDDGSCEYSEVTFYTSASFFNGIAITRVELSVEGNIIGNTNGTFFPNGPGNCSAPGTIAYEFSNEDSVDWNATVFLASGATIISSGTATPNSFSECIKINMTK